MPHTMPPASHEFPPKENRFYRERVTWKDHIKAAILDLRSHDRSEFEQQVYDALRIFADKHLEE